MRVLSLRVRLGRRITVGFDTRIGPGCRIVAAANGCLQLNGANLSRSVTLEVSENAVLKVGRAFVGPGSILSSREHISIGDGCQIADYVTIRDHNHVHSSDHPLSQWRFTTAPVVLGDDVWLASKVTVVAGVSIGDHGFCAAGAVVTHDVGTWQRVGGVPARPLRQSDPDRASPADVRLEILKPCSVGVPTGAAAPGE
jgi:acetyltransferase-like isoleucine patch superfamily enzyme